jgi:hypothetical protein
MNRFEKISAKIDEQFANDTHRRTIARRVLKHTQTWYEEYSKNGETKPIEEQKAECRDFVKLKMKDERFGFVGSIISAILFQLIVKVLVDWIVQNFFSKEAE